MKTVASFKLSKPVKTVMAGFTNKVKMHEYKNLMIDAESAEHKAKQMRFRNKEFGDSID